MQPLCSELVLWLLSPPAGFRIGKGEGFADMEYGMMASMGAVNDATVVVTIVHDCQVREVILLDFIMGHGAGSTSLSFPFKGVM